MRSARRSVDWRWAMRIVVRPCARSSLVIVRSAPWIRSSVSASIDDVASSSTMTDGSVSNDRARAMRWRWPPDNVRPRSPTMVVVAVRQAADEPVGLGQAGRRRRSRPRSRPAARRRCCPAPTSEKRNTSSNATAIWRRRECSVASPDVDAVDGDPPRRHVVEARQEHRRGRLARAAGADQRHRLAGAHGEVEPVEHVAAALVVVEVDVLEADLRAHRAERHGVGRVDDVRRACRGCRATARRRPAPAG